MKRRFWLVENVDKSNIKDRRLMWSGDIFYWIAAIFFNIIFIRNVLLIIAKYFQSGNSLFSSHIKFTLYFHYAHLIITFLSVFCNELRKYVVIFLSLMSLFSLCLIKQEYSQYDAIVFASFLFIGSILLSLNCMEFSIIFGFPRLKVFVFGVFLFSLCAFLNESSSLRMLNTSDFRLLLYDMRNRIKFPLSEDINGKQFSQLNEEKYSIVNADKFIIGLRNILESNMTYYKKFFNAGVFNIMIVDNVLFCHVNICNAAFYFSSYVLTFDPQKEIQKTKKYITASLKIIQFYHLLNKMHKLGFDRETLSLPMLLSSMPFDLSFEKELQNGGFVPLEYLASPDLISPVLFEGISDLYVPFFIFKNNLPY